MFQTATKENFIRIENLSIGYYGKSKSLFILENLNLSTRKGELLALIGANGMGKSTLLRTICKLIPKIEGKIFIDNKISDNITLNELAKLISFVSTEKIAVNQLTVYELITIGRHPYTNWFGYIDQSQKKYIDFAIETLNLQKFVNRKINELSDGEKQKVMIARTLAQDSQIIILDEPTAFLDIANKFEIVGILHQLCSQFNKTIIFSTHDLSLAINRVDKIWLILPTGEVCQGAPEDLALTNKYNQLFSLQNTIYDEHSGEFNTKIKATKPIRIIGEPQSAIFRQTEKALQRKGYAQSNEAPVAIELESGISQNCWKIYKDNAPVAEANSIYDLCGIIDAN